MRCILALLACVSVLFLSEAKAAEYAFQDIAFSTCQSHLSTASSAKTSSGRSYAIEKACSLNPAGKAYLCQVRDTQQNTYWACRFFVDKNQFDTEYTWKSVNTCSTKPPLTNVSFSGAPGPVCSGTCTYSPVLGAGSKYRTVGSGASMRTFADSMSPNGSSCTTETELKESKPDQSVCYSTGAAFSECVKPDGQHCVTGAKGSTLCWQPGEVGPRMTVDGSYSADRQKDPATPTPPKEQTDATLIQSSQTGINGTTYNTSTYSGSGNSGGQSNTGGGKDNGSGGAGSGNGGDGDGEGDGDGAGGVGSGVGKLYEGTNSTIATLLTAHYNKITATPMLASIRSFMMINGGGSCPVFTIAATQWYPTMVLDQHCSGAFYSSLQLCGWVLLGIVSYLAIRIAVT